MNMTEITLGSKSMEKLAALKEACEILGINPKISSVKTNSGQNEQPEGWTETYGGALARAFSARQLNPQGISIGIESGIMQIANSYPVTIDLAVIVVIDKNDKRIITTSTGIVFPEALVKIARDRGFKNTTVGSVIAEQLGGDPTDPHSLLTNGRMSRAQSMIDALVAALSQLS